VSLVVSTSAVDCNAVQLTVGKQRLIFALTKQVDIEIFSIAQLLCRVL